VWVNEEDHIRCISMQVHNISTMLHSFSS
jgi:hypothetical protein